MTQLNGAYQAIYDDVVSYARFMVMTLQQGWLLMEMEIRPLLQAARNLDLLQAAKQSLQKFLVCSCGCSLAWNINRGWPRPGFNFGVITLP